MLPLWATILHAADYDPLLAQEIEHELGEMPEPLLKAVLLAAHSNPLRAREIMRGLSSRWWYRWSMMIEQRANAEE